MTTSTAEIKAATKTALDEFAAGFDGKRPEPWVVEMASRIANAALVKTREPDVSFDDMEGSLSLDLRLFNGHLLLAELEVDGNIDASVYDREKRRVKRMPREVEADMTA